MPLFSSFAPFLGGGHVVIAGGDDDVTPADLIQWIEPVLMGLQDRPWIAAKLDWNTRLIANGMCRCWNQQPRSLSRVGFDGSESHTLAALLPSDAAAIIMVSERVPQILALLDSTARWLMAFDRQDKRFDALFPILDLLTEAAEATAMPSKKGSVAGALLKPAAE